MIGARPKPPTPRPPARVTIWRVPLRLSGRRLTRLLPLLDHGERERAGRFRFERDRARYIASHAAVRIVLGEWVGMPPAGLRFHPGQHGKPALDGGPHFNLTHAEDLALLAVASAPVGVDVERISDFAGLEEVARHCFTATESRVMAAGEAARTELFFRCWTRKEAYLKAVGGGLGIPLRTVEVDLGERPTLRSIEGDAEAAAEWSLRHLTPLPGYVGALAVRSRSCEVRTRTFRWGARRRAQIVCAPDPRTAWTGGDR